jgi:hypothetical protein
MPINLERVESAARLIPDHLTSQRIKLEKATKAVLPEFVASKPANISYWKPLGWLRHVVGYEKKNLFGGFPDH